MASSADERAMDVDFPSEEDYEHLIEDYSHLDRKSTRLNSSHRR